MKNSGLSNKTLKVSLMRTTVLEDCILWKGPKLEQLLKKCSLWEGPKLSKLMKNCLMWEGPHAGAGGDSEFCP